MDTKKSEKKINLNIRSLYHQLCLEDFYANWFGLNLDHTPSVLTSSQNSFKQGRFGKDVPRQKIRNIFQQLLLAMDFVLYAEKD